MWRIVGEDKTTGKTVEITTADNPTEKVMILREEARNYRNVRAVGMSVPLEGRRRAEGQTGGGR